MVYGKILFFRKIKIFKVIMFKKNKRKFDDLIMEKEPQKTDFNKLTHFQIFFV